MFIWKCVSQTYGSKVKHIQFSAINYIVQLKRAYSNKYEWQSPSEINQSHSNVIAIYPKIYTILIFDRLDLTPFHKSNSVFFVSSNPLCTNPLTPRTCNPHFTFSHICLLIFHSSQSNCTPPFSSRIIVLSINGHIYRQCHIHLMNSIDGDLTLSNQRLKVDFMTKDVINI